MKNTPLILMLVMTMLYAGSTVQLARTDMQSKDCQVNLEISSDQDVMGIQFDMQYNPNELQFVTVATELPGFQLDFRDKGNGLVRGLMFSMNADRIPAQTLINALHFDFEPAEGFSGESQIVFTDLILAGQGGTKLAADLPTFTVNAETLTPLKTQLKEAYPNPFNPTTTISYDLSVEGQVNIAIYDLQGRQVSNLVNRVQPAGNYAITWNASEFASSVYFLKMNTAEYSETQKIVLTK